jgi:hypothetical protein
VPDAQKSGCATRALRPILMIDCEVDVRPCPVLLSAVLVLGLGLGGAAAAAETKTSKERLSDKASDEQRVDDCRVPIERRTSRNRPDCPADGAQPRGPAPANAAGVR